MIDSVLKGTGNSRFLKSAVPAGTSWADALAMLQAGTFPIDFNGINTEGFQQVGTPLNKANLLKDATAAQIGLPPSTTPDGMFQALGNTGELHVWRKTVVTTKPIPEVPAGYTLGTKTNTLIATSGSSQASRQPAVQIVYADSVSVDNSGNVSISGNLGWIYVWEGDHGGYELDYSAYRGKFIQIYNKQNANLSNVKLYDIYYVPSNATITKGTMLTYGVPLYIELQTVTGYPYTPAIPAGTTTTYPVSTNPNAYQEGDDAKEAGYVVGEVENNVQILSGGDNWPTTLYYADSVDVDNEGQLSLQSPNQYTFTTSSQYQNVSTLAVGRFIKIVPEASSGFLFRDGIWFVPSDATVTVSNYKIYASKIQKVTGYAAIPAGTTIEYLGKLGDKARVQVVSYVGTGTYGSSNPCSLAFDFAPKVVMFLRGYKESFTQFNYLYGSYGSDSLVIISADLSNIFAAYNGFGRYNRAYAKKDLSGRTITWYSNEDSNSQANASGVTHYFLAIG